jgi:hypothetical protein
VHDRDQDDDKQFSADESSIRREITEAMIMAGVMAYEKWKLRRRTDEGLSSADLASNVYVAMRRAGKKVYL